MKTTATRLYPFVPSGPDFAGSIAFFETIGFVKQWEYSGIAGLKFGAAYFILQEADIPEWQKNQMITFEVNDLEEYWHEFESLDLPGKFPGVSLHPPKDFPWGRELHFIDLAGVCWHVRQSV